MLISVVTILFFQRIGIISLAEDISNLREEPFFTADVEPVAADLKGETPKNLL